MYYSQHDKELNSKLPNYGFKENGLSRWGCYVISIITAVSVITRRKIEREEIIHICSDSIKKGYLDNEYFIQDPNNFVKLVDPRFYYIGWASPKGENKEGAIFSVECWVDDRKFKHFKNSFHNSYYPKGPTNTVTNGWLDSYRVFGMKD